MVLTNPNTAEPKPGAIAIVGVPFDEYSSHMLGCAEGPRHLRRALHSGATNWCAENGMDLSAEKQYQDLGNCVLESGDQALDHIFNAFAHFLDCEARMIAIGGDHAITYPIVKAYARCYQPLTILHFDAHPDLYDTYDGNRHSHACPFARIMEKNLAKRLIQLGIRSINGHQKRQAERFGVEILEMRSWTGRLPADLQGPLYISLDLDVLDPAYAPGVSHHEPGGLSTRDVLSIIQQIRAPIVGADIVELNPKRDYQDMTAMVAAKCLKEIAGSMIQFPFKKELSSYIDRMR